MATATNITVKPFDGTGYSNWEFRIKMLLEHHDVLEVLEQDAPTDQAQLASFKKKDVKARNLIVLSLADNVLEIVKSKKTDKEMLTELKGTYELKWIANQVNLQRKMRTMKFISGKLNEFLLEFEKTVSELRNCGGTIQETQVISQLLSVMSESYQTVTTAIDILFC